MFFALWEEASLVHSPKGFLGTVARNKAKNKLRELTDNLPLNDYILVTDEDGLEAKTEKKELSAAVKQAVLAMRQPDKDIFLRFYYYYQSLEEISTEMGIGLSTVKSRLRRGRAKLKQTLLRYIT